MSARQLETIWDQTTCPSFIPASHSPGIYCRGELVPETIIAIFYADDAKNVSPASRGHKESC